MLKLHHLNLMNEIQETALMLNLYEQQQLAREQQEEMRRIEKARLLEKQRQPAESISDEIKVGDRTDKKRTFNNSEVPNKRQK